MRQKLDLSDKLPSSFKKLRGYLIDNGGYDCFSKWGGKVYKISRKGDWIEVCRNISDLTYNEYLKESLKNE